MRRVVFLGRLLPRALLLFVANVAVADAVPVAADAVLAAVRSGSDLKPLAGKDDPDPWLVADELCARGEHDAAEAFARAAPRKETERLSEYVAAQRARPTGPGARKALVAALLAEDPSQALATLEAVELGEDVASVEILRTRCLALRKLDRLKECAEAAGAAARAAEQLGWSARAGTSLHERGWCAWMCFDYAAALASLESALRLQEQLADRKSLAATLFTAGAIQENLASYTRAVEYLESARKLEEALGNRWATARALTLMGICYRRLGFLAKALECQERALELATNRFDKSFTMSGLAAIYGDLGSLDKAAHYYEQALAVQEELRYPGRASILMSLGGIQGRLGSREKSFEYLERALEVAEADEDPHTLVVVLQGVGTIYARWRENARALECLERALKLTEATGLRTEISASLGGTGIVLAALGNHAEAEVRYRRALELGRESREADQAIWATELGRLLAEQLGRPAEALPFLEEAIALIEEQREEGRAFSDREQARYSDLLRSGGAFECMARTQLRLDRPGDALGYVERGRARAVLDLLERSRFDPLREAARRAREQGDDARVREIDDLVEAVEAADREAVRATKVLDAGRAAKDPRQEAVSAAGRDRIAALERRDALLGRRARLVRDLLPVGSPVSPAALQLGLGPKERILFYVFDESGGLLFVVPPAGREIKGYVLAWPDGGVVDAKSLAEAVDAWLLAMRRRGGRGLEGPGSVVADRGLFHALAPAAVREEIAGLDRVYVIPHGPLHRLPLEALDVGDGQVWLDWGPPVAYGYSGSVLQWCRKRRDAQRGAKPRFDVVALGGAAYEPPLSPLPGSRREVESIRATIGKDATAVLVGPEATASRLFEFAPRARYLHLATHLIADERERFGESRLAFTPEGDDGFLTLHDVFERWRDRLSACELVVLSACDVQKGPLQRDEGPYAMPLGFLYAGAPAVIGTLWRVDDESTADLFADFYKRPREGGKLRAFTEARRELRKRHPEPYFWAPFVYIGDPR